MSNIYVDKLNEAITVLGGEPVTAPAGNVYVAKLDEVIASLTALRDEIARDRAAIFNNDGNPHTQNTDFNALPATYAAHYVSNGNGNTPVSNGPPLATASQFYGFTLGQGTPHEPSAYSSQLYWPRTGSPYLNVRFRENGSFTTWSKIHAGYADAVAASGISGTLDDARLSANIPKINTTNTFTGGLAMTGNATKELAIGVASPSPSGRGSLSFVKSRGTTISPVTVANGDWLGSITASGYDSAAFHKTAYITFSVSDTIGLNVIPAAIDFYTSPTVESAIGRRLRVMPTGSVLVGKATGLSAAGDLDVAGKIRGDTLETAAGSLWKLAGYTADSTDRVSNGYVTVTIDGVAYKLLTRS